MQGGGGSKSKRLVHWSAPGETWDLQQMLGEPAGARAVPAAQSVKETHRRRDAQSTSTAGELTAKCKSKRQFWILLQLQAGAGKSLASQGERLQCDEGGELRDPLSYMHLIQTLELGFLKHFKTKGTRSCASPAGTRWTSFILPPTSVKFLIRGSRRWLLSVR